MRITISEQVRTVVFFYLLLTLCLFLPFSIPLTSITIILLAVHWLISGNLSKNYLQLFRNKLVRVFCLLYVLYVIGMLYTSYWPEGMFNLEQKLSLLAFPLILSIAPRLTGKQSAMVLHFFVAVCLAATLFCLGHSAYRLYHHDDTYRSTNWDIMSRIDFESRNQIIPNALDYFSYTELSLAIDIHPTYLAMYVTFCVAILLYSLANYDEKPDLKRKMISVALIIYFIGIVVLLSARIVILALTVTLLLYTIVYFKRRRQLIKGLAVLFGGLILLTIIIYSNPTTRYRFIQQPLNTKIALPQDHNQWNATNLRFAQWFCSVEGIKKNWLYGVGTGDDKHELVACYKQIDLGPYFSQYNSHNQYLQTWLSIGITGLLSFVAALFIPAIMAIKEKNFLWLSFILLFSICCLTESMLGTQKGVVFYAFFNSFFAFLQRSNSPDKLQSFP